MKAKRELVEGKAASKFMQAIRRMVDENDPSPAVSWSARGDSFLIPSEEEFLRLLPKYFKTKNFSSFVRQLNMYDFKKAKNEKASHEFRHPLFLRDSPQLLCQIIRKSSEKQQHDSTGSASQVKPAEPCREQVSETAWKQVLQELDDSKRQYKARVSKLMVFMFLLGVRPELVSEVKRLFVGCEGASLEGDDGAAFMSLIDAATETIFTSRPQSGIDELLLSSLGRETFSMIFPQNTVPKTFEQLSQLIMSQPRREEPEGFERDSQFERSLRLREDFGAQTPTCRNFQIQAAASDMSDSFSLFDRPQLCRRRRKFDPLLSPKNEAE